MTRFFIACVLAVAVVLPQDTEAQAWQKAQAHWNAGHRAEARAAFEDFAAKYPKSAFAPDALLRMIETTDRKDDEETAKAKEACRRLVRDYPDSAAAASAPHFAAGLGGWSFSHIPERVLPSPDHRLTFDRTWGPPSTFALYRLPAAALRKAFDADAGTTAVPRSAWIKCDSFVEDYPFAERLSREHYVDLKEPGDYYVEEVIDGFKALHPLRVVGFGLYAKSVGPRVIAYAFDPVKGSSVSGIEVQLKTNGKRFTSRTDKSGIAILDAVVDGEDARLLGSDGTTVHVISLWGEKTGSEELCFVTTDRPVYRPGQVVQFKAIRREADGAALSMKPWPATRVEIRDPHGRLVQAGDHAWNRDGSLSGAFSLADEPPLGDWTVLVHVPKKDEHSWWWEDEPVPFWKKKFHVAAYRKPEFRVSVDFPGRSIVGLQQVRARIHAEYYFGGPVADGDVEWRVERRWSWWWRSRDTWPQPAFDEPLAWLYTRTGNDADPWWYDVEEIATGLGKLGADGALEVAFEAPESKWPAKYTLIATVRDLSRLTAMGEGAVESNPSSLKIQVASGRLFHEPGEKMTARARVTTFDGKPVAGREVEFAAFLAQPIDTAPPGPNAPLPEVEFESFHKSKAKTDADGRVSVEFAAGEAGHVRLRARVKDNDGRTAESRVELWTAGEEMMTDWNEFLVLPDKAVYEEGETARLMVTSEIPDLQALVLVEGGTLHDARVVTLKGRCQIIEVPLLAVHAPNCFVKIMAWKEGGILGGGHELFVLPKRRALNVKVTTDKASYGPRERAKVTLTTTIDGRPAAAEVELGIVDESIFAIKPDKTPDIRGFFLKLRDDISSGASNWGWVEDYRTFRDGASMGGVALTGASFSAEDGVPQEATAEFAATETRRLFPDTLFYSAHARTGPDGTVVLDIETPDSLTEWRLTARGLAGIDAFGSAVSSTITKKDVICRLVAPRFWTDRDEGSVATIVHNNLAVETQFVVRLTTNGVQQEKRLTVAARAIGRLDWPVTAANVGEILLKAEALSKASSDAMELTVPVKPHGVELQSSKSGRVAGTWKQTLSVPADGSHASLEVVVTASGASAALEALPYLAGYPYGCAEQTMSRFLPSITAWRAMKKLGLPSEALEKEIPKMVDQGLQRLYGFQHGDGGWGWWKNDATDEWMTAYVLYGLLTAKEAGFEIDKHAIAKGLEALKGMAAKPFALHVRKMGGEDVNLAVETADPEEIAWLVLAGRKELASRLTFEPKAASGHQVRVVALALRAIVSVDPRDARVGPMFEWLLMQRRGSAWYSTLDSAYAVYALVEIAGTAKEPAVTVLVNGREVSTRCGRVIVKELKPGANEVEVKSSGDGLVFASALLKWRTSAESLPATKGPIDLSRRLERAVMKEGGKEWVEVKDGGISIDDELRVVLTVSTENEADESFVMIECPIPAGTEPRESESADYDWWESWYQTRELRDDRVCVAARYVGRQPREFTFRLRATAPGTYHVMPAVAFAMYEPDRRGTTSEWRIRVK